MSNSPFKFTDPKPPYWSSPVADAFEKNMKELQRVHVEHQNDWIKEFISILMEKHKVKFVVSDGAGAPRLERIICDGKIVSSKTFNGLTSYTIWRDPEFYGIKKEEK